MEFFQILRNLKVIISHENDALFNSILGDNYNLNSNYSYSYDNYDNIKIKHII